MKAYKANVVKWTHENGFETTDNVIVGKLWRNPSEPWCIAYEIAEDHQAVKQYMVDKDTVEEVEGKQMTDEKELIYWFEEVE